jgi:microcystin-dependent protein
MAQPVIGEIRMFAGNFAPAGWMFCQGQLLPISENETLFNVLGTMYGGDGQSTFALPDLRGRLPLHQGSGFTVAETGGVQEVTLTVPQITAHSHPLLATSGAGGNKVGTGLLFAVAQGDVYTTSNSNKSLMAAGSVGPVGGSQPHTNFQPYLCIDFIISLFGLFPSPS